MMLRRARKILLVLGLLVVPLGFAVIVDRSAVPARAVPGFGAGPVQSGSARTQAWDDVRQLHPGLVADSRNSCERGDPTCLDAVVSEMEARLDGVGCGHSAPFAFTYLEMTRGVQRHVDEPGFFKVPQGTSHLDAIFARLYFDASDNWTAGRTDNVPGAWQMAFGAADSGRSSAAADLLLGMNAHIARDLPYAVASAIAAQPALAEDPTDFNRVNEVIAGVKGPMLRDAAARYDPTLADLDRPLPALAGSDTVELIGIWRNQAFERGKRLATVPEGERAAVAAEIDREAVATAVLILNADSAGQLPSSVDRNTYCATQAVR